MSEWWTYRLSDFLLFSARTYYRLFELYNAEVWPVHPVALALGLAIAALALRGRAWAAAVASALLALCWWWVAWAFHWQRYTTINWAAPWFAAAFAFEGLLLLVVVRFHAQVRLAAGSGAARSVGLGLWLVALVVQPGVGVLVGRPWRQAELFGLAPDPTAIATLGLLLLLRPADSASPQTPNRPWVWVLWPVPLLWCAISGATLWALHAPDAWLPPCAALLAAAMAWRGGAAGSR